MKYIALLIFSLSAAAEPLCSPLNYCHVKKSTWHDKGGFKILAEKDFSFKHFCDTDSPEVELEKDLGIDLFLANANKAMQGISGQPHVTIDLHTYKRTYVIASVDVPIDNVSVRFSHRLKSDRHQIVEVECGKK